jgi:hypothetical protein
MPNQNRRKFIKNTLLALPLATVVMAAKEIPTFLLKDEKLKIICVGGHPDDPESVEKNLILNNKFIYI